MNTQKRHAVKGEKIIVTSILPNTYFGNLTPVALGDELEVKSVRQNGHALTEKGFIFIEEYEVIVDADE